IFLISTGILVYLHVSSLIYQVIKKPLD
ncbi:uncharacterized protein METZ01_LOCUS422048, partial [marine metagenome]